MTATTITVHVPEERGVPRAMAFIELALTFSIGLKRYISKKLSERALKRDAMALRAYADSIRHSDPSLAADLFAAADRQA